MEKYPFYPFLSGALITVTIFSVTRPVAVQVKHINGKTIPLPPLKRSSTIAEVKAMFQDIEGIPVDHQCLCIYGKKAENDRILEYYGKYSVQQELLGCVGSRLSLSIHFFKGENFLG